MSLKKGDVVWFLPASILIAKGLRQGVMRRDQPPSHTWDKWVWVDETKTSYPYQVDATNYVWATLQEAVDGVNELIQQQLIIQKRRNDQLSKLWENVKKQAADAEK